MEIHRTPRQAMFWTPENKRRNGRLRQSLRENVIVDLREVNCQQLPRTLQELVK